MTTPKTVGEALSRGYAVDLSAFPWIAYKGPRTEPTESHEIPFPSEGFDCYPWHASLDIRAYYDWRGHLYFGAGTPAGVAWVERTFPGGTWMHDHEGTPRYAVPGLRAESVTME